jgi:dTDP-4-amino-4,6-dideoxygalactose transaminase
MFYLVLPSLEARQALITYLNTREISSVFHYLPLHLSRMGRQFGGKKGDCPVTEEVSERLVRLPFYNELTEADQMRVLAVVKDFRWEAS